MKRTSHIAALAILIGTLSVSGTLSAKERLGHVAEASGESLQLCFDPQTALPAAGEAVRIVRRMHSGSQKSGLPFRKRTVGVARIGDDRSGPCVAATLIKGKARRQDDVRK
ncbi:hypothetical protein [Lysobacter hankyongensis]|uniref:UrcA family protein n=1 Tax=Lysobacter hankyongensis TaxID=1176535 RepID=A0ABP9AJV1_9GAMM